MIHRWIELFAFARKAGVFRELVSQAGRRVRFAVTWGDGRSGTKYSKGCTFYGSWVNSRTPAGTRWQSTTVAMPVSALVLRCASGSMSVAIQTI